MHLVQLIVASLVANKVYANSEIPLSFFVKVGDRLKPLVAVPSLSDEEKFQKLSYEMVGNEYPPVQFNLKGNHALTDQTAFPGYASFIENHFGVNSTSKPTDLKWDSEMKILNGPFYSCRDSFRTHRIMVNTPSDGCYSVNLYLLPYDHVSKQAVRPVPPKLPMAFFTKINGIFEPLSTINLGENFGNLSLFTHRHPTVSPAKISYVDHIPSLDSPNSAKEWVGFQEGQFMMGSIISPTTIHLNSEWSVLHGPFYSCALDKSMPDSVRGISNYVPEDLTSVCFEVKIYLLPYRRIAGSGAVGTSTSIEYLYEEDYRI